jgi:hypothetical protein
VRVQLVAWTLSIGLLFAVHGNAQTGNTHPPNPSWQATPAAPPLKPELLPNGEADEAQQRQSREIAKKANLERQAALKTDADKLLKLATELKTSVDKSSENVLSLEVMKKAEEIEKLAHSVKDKMKGPN